MAFVANFICFPAVQKFENRLRFEKVTESLKVGTFLRDSVFRHIHTLHVPTANWLYSCYNSVVHNYVCCACMATVR